MRPANLRAALVLLAAFMLAISVQADAGDYKPDSRSIAIGPPAETPWMNGAQVQLIGNGSFETESFPPWIFDSQGAGSWFVTNQSVAPLSGRPLQPPSDGLWQAVVDQTGPGRQILYQQFTIPAGHVAVLHLVYWYNNSAGVFSNAGNLGYLGVPNQHMRIDIMDSSAPIDDTGAGVLDNLFITNPGDPADVTPTALQADLSMFAGQTIRLRIAEVDNQDYFTVGIDAVSIQATGATPIQEMTWGSIKSIHR